MRHCQFFFLRFRRVWHKQHNQIELCAWNFSRPLFLPSFVHEKCVNVMKAISHDGTSCLCVKLSHGNIYRVRMYIYDTCKCFLIKCHHIWKLFSLTFSESKVLETFSGCTNWRVKKKCLMILNDFNYESSSWSNITLEWICKSKLTQISR